MLSSFKTSLSLAANTPRNHFSLFQNASLRPSFLNAGAISSTVQRPIVPILSLSLVCGFAAKAAPAKKAPAASGKSVVKAKASPKTAKPTPKPAKSVVKATPKETPKAAKPAAKAAEKTVKVPRKAKPNMVTGKVSRLNEKFSKEKLAAQREKEKVRTQKEKERAVQAKEKEKQRTQKDKENEKLEVAKQKKKDAREAKKNAPKRSKSSFVFYVMDQFNGAKKGETNVKDVIKGLAAKWKTMSDSEKKAYNEQAKKDRVRYEKEKAEAAKNAPPKKPLTSFLIYANEQRAAVQAANPKLTMPEVGKALGEKWRTLSENEKAKYNKIAEKAQEEFRKKYAEK
eukprot:TRINITY_DN482_c0_g1_i1.p1 TRINITY_DN482_c0_g1~~TRINITY_DN482_c0_g1_i1.p1  ORF type:complete len:341 (+),score=135.48 TRINITY_DN482_c0_g1_i1:124-1146(+)